MRPGKAHIDVTALELKALAAFAGPEPFDKPATLFFGSRLAYATNGHAMAFLGDREAAEPMRAVCKSAVPDLVTMAKSSKSGHVRIGSRGTDLPTSDAQPYGIANLLTAARQAGKPTGAFRWELAPTYMALLRGVIRAIPETPERKPWSVLIHAPHTEMDPTLFTVGQWSVLIMPCRQDDWTAANRERIERNAKLGKVEK